MKIIIKLKNVVSVNVDHYVNNNMNKVLLSNHRGYHSISICAGTCLLLLMDSS